MRVLITRPEDDAQPLARRLAARGIESLVEPLLIIVPVAGAELDLDGVQALLVTSANGARALARAGARRDLPLYAVGEASGASARALGFAAVRSAGGDVEALADKVIAELDPGAGALVHVAGSAVAGDLAGRLGGAGFEARRAVLYEARPVAALSPGCVAALVGRSLDAALLFSPRTAATFVRLAGQAAVAECCRELDALCLSEAVAGAAARLDWRRLEVASEPTAESLLDLLPGGPSGARWRLNQ